MSSFWKVTIDTFYLFKFRILRQNAATGQIDWRGPLNTIIVFGQNDIFYRKKQKMTVITLLPNLLPDLQDWNIMLENFTERGYNTFHFAPLQQIGESKSAYSIKDHHKFSVSDPKKMKKILRTAQSKGSYFFTDIVLNHISHDSPVLVKPEHEAFYYNVGNTPFLAPILDLDVLLYSLGPQIVQKFFNGEPKAKINNHGQIEKIIDFVKKEIIALKLYEFYLIDLEKLDFRLTPKKATPFDFNSQLNVTEAQEFILTSLKSTLEFQTEHLERVGFGRFSATPSGKFMSENNESKASEALSYYNQVFKSQYKEEVLKPILANLRSFLIHHKLKKDEQITMAYNKTHQQIFPRYFRKLQRGKKTTTNDYALLNGWLYENTSASDLLSNNGISYLKREVIIWEDLVKFNFVNLDKKPLLQDYIRTYLKSMESIFDGFRLDNLHNTHPNIIKFMLKTLSDIARSRADSKQVMILGELFIGNRSKEVDFCNGLGVHYLTRELIHHWGKDTPLPYKKDDGEPEIFFLQTHDNETYPHLNKTNLFLPHLSHSIASAGHVHAGSTLFSDELYPEKFETCDWTKQYDFSVFGLKCDFGASDALQGATNEKGWLQENQIPWLYNRVIWYKKEHEHENFVMVKGSWNGWSDPIHLSKVSDGHFWGKMEAHPGDQTFKFIVNGGEWKCSQIYLKNPDMNTGDEHSNHLFKIKHVSADQSIRVWHPSQGASRVRKKVHEFKAESLAKRLVEGTRRPSTLILDWNTHLYQTVVYKHLEPRTPAHIDLEMYQILVKNGTEGGVPIVPVFSQITFFEVISLAHTADGKPYYVSDNNLNRYGFLDNDKLYLVNLPEICTVLVKSEAGLLGFEPIQSLVLKKVKSNYSLDNELNLDQLNYLLYSCEAEEKERNGGGTYDVPHYKKFLYGGITSLIQAFQDPDGAQKIKLHLNDGFWLVDFYFNRLEYIFPGDRKFKNLRKFLKDKLPLPLLYEYFRAIFEAIYQILLKNFLRPIQLDEDHLHSEFMTLMLSTIPQFFSAGEFSAGLPYFCATIWKEWGRDTFIAFPGILLASRRYNEARGIILSYAKTFKKGLIPNMKRHLQYTARDATWWFFYSLGKYLEYTGDYSILEEPFEKEDDKSETTNFLELLEDSLKVHFDGGTIYDMVIDKKTGFEVLRNGKNTQLTWMDKKADGKDNGGKCCTPREGAPVELTALMWYTFNMMANLCKNYQRLENADIKQRYELYKTTVRDNRTTLTLV